MVQGGGVPSWHIAGPALVGCGASVESVVAVVVQPAIRPTVISNLPMSFTVAP
jgi:hypothetical protein